jgi:uncharacterized protein (DUF305 family)
MALSVLTVLTVLVTTGCGGGEAPPTSMGPSPTTATSASDVPGSFPVTPGPPATGPRSDADLVFVEHLVQHHRQALELCRLARRHSRNPALLALADRISTDQTRELATLTGWLTGWQHPIPEGLGGHVGAHSDEVTDGSLSENDWKELHATPPTQIEAAILYYLQAHNTGTIIFAGHYLDDTLHPARNDQVKELAAQMEANRSQRNRELGPVLRAVRAGS